LRESKVSALAGTRSASKESRQLAKLEAEVSRLRTRNEDADTRLSQSEDLRRKLEKEINDARAKNRELDDEVERLADELDKEKFSNAQLKSKASTFASGI